MSGSNIFLPSGPRQLLLSAALALELASGDENLLFLIEHLPAADTARYVEIINQWSASPFAGTRVLEADYRSRLGGQPRDAARRRIKKHFRNRNRALIDEALARRPPDRIFANVDDYYEVQYLLHRSRRANPARKAIYIEDGTSAYEHSYRNLHLRNRPKEWLRALRYFPWWKPSPVPGASGWFDEGYMAYPDLVLAELSGITMRALPQERFHSEAMRALAEAIARQLGLDCEALNRADVLIAVTNSKWGSLLPNYRQTMQALCTRLLDSGRRVAIKMHPGDRHDDPLGLEDHPGLYRIPASVVFEVLAMLSDKPDTVVIGDASTALMASKWLRPQWRVVALRHAPDGIDGRYLERLFSGIGVEIETEAARLGNSCIACPPAAPQRGTAA